MAGQKEWNVMGCKANSPCPPGCCKGKDAKDLSGKFRKDMKSNPKPMSPGVEEKFEGLRK